MGKSVPDRLTGLKTGHLASTASGPVPDVSEDVFVYP